MSLTMKRSLSSLYSVGFNENGPKALDEQLMEKKKEACALKRFGG